MLKPSMNELMKRVDNRYLLVNLAAQRARDLSDEAEETEEPLTDKAVKLALDEIASGRIEYRDGPRVIDDAPQHTALGLDGALELDLANEEEIEPTESAAPGTEKDDD